jgi:bla regulator protein blaR1
MISGQANFLQALGWAVLNSLWQMALLWLLFQIITSLFRSSRANFKSSLATFLLINGFAWFLFTFFSFYNNHGSNGLAFSASFLDQFENRDLNLWLEQGLAIASILYLVLLVFPLAQFIRNYRYVQVIRKYGLSKADVMLKVFVKKVALHMGIRKKVKILISEFVSSPVTIGFFKPVILVPLAAINNLSTQQMEAVMLHELAHIRRHDYIVNLVINFIRTILYFNPFVRAFVKIVESEREKSCDQMVLQFQYDSYEYATALLTLEKTNSELKPFAIGATGTKNDLLKRVELIMGVKSKSSLSINKFAGLLTGLICIMALNVLLFISKPSVGKTGDYFATLSAPFNFFADPGSEQQERKQFTEPNTPEIAEINISENTDSESKSSLIGILSPSPGVINVNFNQLETLQLKKYEEDQVKAAISASKKVLANEEWKALELKIADVFTQRQKEELKITYKKAMDKMDWNKWENELRIAYDKVDWNRVNEQLAKAVNNIRIDSLQKVYTEAICKLELTKKELTQNNLPGIPDTDITVKAIEETKQQVQKTLNRLKSFRSKKIVHL